MTTNYTLDLVTGLTQVLSDGANTYLYGNGRIAQAGSTTEYFLGDALGSVRQLTDTAGTVTLTQSYAPYGQITESVGTSQTSYAFTGEALDANGLTYLRARYYAPQDGRFISRDTWAGVYNRPLSLNRWGYVEGNPVNNTDPRGYGALGPLNMAMCFNLSAVVGISQWDWHGTSAGLAIDICREAYNKNNWTMNSTGTLPSTTSELWAWYVNEYGGEHLWFDGNQPLTRELAKSTLIQDIRVFFYKEGDTVLPKLYKFNLPEIIGSSIYDIRNSPLPITQFLGSFYYQVINLKNGRVGFRIDNDTTLESGTHFAGRFPDEGFGGSIEELIEKNPSIADKSLVQVFREYPVISILSSKTRSETYGSEGGGTMYQTYAWTENYDECLASKLPWEVWGFLLDVDVWENAQNQTYSPFGE